MLQDHLPADFAFACWANTFFRFRHLLVIVLHLHRLTLLVPISKVAASQILSDSLGQAFNFMPVRCVNIVVRHPCLMCSFSH